MLTQQGLAEISKATQSEQVAYLLMERARLLDELNEHNNSRGHPESSDHSPDTELQRILERVKNSILNRKLYVYNII